MEYWRVRIKPVENAERTGRPAGEHRSRPRMEKLRTETIGKPPELNIRRMSFPDLLAHTPKGVLDIMRDDGVRIQIHPDQFDKIPKPMLELMKTEGIEPSVKFLISEETGRRVDRLA
jgi:hypothetical protein